ncbi:hypothetical protein EZV62_026485 [Acer yangbiense]|uniref:Gnk2-homologous domain-containing protein n=1 Tax=Acer yangbiense TaxID=1000413 RepID=A0A5C7GQV7_9ROSI|nr:hypothetical protein EZV62_026485 [Acer yangbiense]
MLDNCPNNNGNYTSNSAFGTNLNSVLSSISSNTVIDYGFYNESVGQEPDMVNAIALCRGDASVDVCRSCLQNATRKILEVCPNQKEAVGWDDNCMLRYSNKTIFGTVELQPIVGLGNTQNVTGSVNEFNQALQDLFGSLRDTAASGNSLQKFATGDKTVNYQRIYALVQCTPDLDRQECIDCLDDTIRQIPTCCSNKRGGRLLNPSCNFRYEENDRFFNPTPNSPPPSTSMTPPAPPTGNDNTVRTVIIIVVPIVSVVILAICIFFFLRRRKRKPKETIGSKLISFIDCQPTYNKHLCLSPDNERASNTYTSNLDSLLISLSSKASVNSFYNDSSNGIYSLFLCRGDVSATMCQTCVNNATQLIRQRCPSRKRAIIWYDECMLRYSNVSFFGRAETSAGLMMWNIQNTTSPDGQNYGALALIYSLIDEASYTDMMFGTVEKVVANGNQNGYALVQCTRDINSSSCRACLGRLTEQIQICCQNRRGWRILSFSCYLRYEEYLFYQQSMAPVSPVPVMPQPMPNDGGKGGSNTMKITIITVSSTLAAVGGAVLGFWGRNE